jgi:hypothetical protein
VSEARIQLRRSAGFRLQEVSRALNGLPARAVTRPHLFGNPFHARPPGSAADSVRTFRRFLRSLSDDAIMRGIKYEDGERAPLEGIGMIVLRNSIRANVWHLRGHNLACFCAIGAPCHADVYLKLLATDWPERWKAKYPKLIHLPRGA